MKIIKKFSAILLILVLSISTIYAEGFPDEPMIIYGNIIGSSVDGKKIIIKDENGNILSESIIKDNKYGTEKTFDLDNKIILNKFNGKLIISIDGYKFGKLELGDTKKCEGELIFQKGEICEYIITFNKRSRGGSSSHSSSKISTSNSTSSDNNSSVNISTNVSDTNGNITDKTQENNTLETNNSENIQNEKIKKIKSISKNEVILTKTNNKYNNIVIKIGNKIETTFQNDEYKKKLINKLNNITELKIKNSDKKTLKNEVVKLIKSYKKLLVKEKILKKISEKKNNVNSVNYTKQNNSVNTEKSKRLKKLREIKTRILNRINK